jgi:hypothetical protein
MGKRGSSAAGTAAGAAAAAAAKKARTADAEGSAVGRWVQTKAGHKELSQAEKMGLLKNTPANRSPPARRSFPDHRSDSG